MNNFKKYIKNSIKILLSLFIISFIIIQALIINEANKVYKQHVDYVIVLGARLYGDRPSPTLINRLDSASDYLNDYKDVKVIVSGGQGPNETVSEASAMASYLENQGISKSQIIIEDKSTSTFENLKFSLDKIKAIDNNNDIKVLIMTNDYHILRSKMLAKRLNLTAYGLASKTPQSTIIKAYTREYFAIIKSFVFDK